MILDQYVWLAWAALFLAPWLLLYAVFPSTAARSAGQAPFTAPFGFAEPLFVPQYWSPLSLLPPPSVDFPALDR